MKIFSTTLLISFMTVFAAPAIAGSDGSENQANQQAKPRLANCKDCLDAGYRRGYADAEAIALENTAAGSSSVTTPLSYRKPVYVQAPSTRPRVRNVKAPAPQPAPRKLPSYVQRMPPKVQPTLPRMQPKHQQAQHIQQTMRHANHGHHTQAQVIDCELTDSLNRNARQITTVISTKRHYQPSAQVRRHHMQVKNPAPVKQYRAPARKPAPLKRVANYKHGNHYHHTNAERADCALTDQLNRNAGPVSRVISRSSNHNYSPVKQHAKQSFAHGNHTHHSAVDKADCALTDALNRGGSVVHVVRKH